jgi:hypothetical protein
MPASKLDDKLMDSKRHPMTVVSEPTTSDKSDPPAAAPPPVTVTLPRQRWLLFDLWADTTAMVRMFFDVRYHVGWFARLAVLVLIPAILCSRLLLWWVPVPSLFYLDAIFFKLVDLLLAFLLFKILSREARRYQEWRAMVRRR